MFATCFFTVQSLLATIVAISSLDLPKSKKGAADQSAPAMGSGHRLFIHKSSHVQQGLDDEADGGLDA